MATQRDALRTYLEADTTLTGILTGGIWDASELDRGGLSPIDLATDAVGRMKPVMVIRWRVATAKEVLRYSERRFVEFYFYDDSGHATIESAKRRLKVLLDGYQLRSTDDAQMNRFWWAHDLGEFVAEEYERAAGDRSTYYVDYTRK